MSKKYEGHFIKFYVLDIYIFNGKDRNLSQFWCFSDPKHQNCDKFWPLSLKIYIKDIKFDKMAFVLFRQWPDLHYIEFSSKSIGPIFFYLNFKIWNRWKIFKKILKNFKKKFLKFFSTWNILHVWYTYTLCKHMRKQMEANE